MRRVPLCCFVLGLPIKVIGFPFSPAFRTPICASSLVGDAEWSLRPSRRQFQTPTCVESSGDSGARKLVRPSRRQFLATTNAAVTAAFAFAGSGSATVMAGGGGTVWGPEGDPARAESWFPILRAGYSTLNELLENWETITATVDGDAVRRYLGTVGVSSPLSVIKRAFATVRDDEAVSDDVDLLEFTEAYQEVLTALSDADNESYSAAFADYSGGGHLKGSQFIAKARISVKIARDHYADALRALKIDP